MRKLLLFILFLLYLSIATTKAQRSYTSYLVKETNPIVLKYIDPAFPADPIVSEVKSDKMAEYVKMHPPIPRLLNNGITANDSLTCTQGQKEWLQHYPYYPQFVPYHLYDRLLSPDDDINIYVTAKAVWNKAHPEKAEEIRISKGNTTD